MKVKFILCTEIFSCSWYLVAKNKRPDLNFVCRDYHYLQFTRFFILMQLLIFSEVGLCWVAAMSYISNDNFFQSVQVYFVI